MKTHILLVVFITIGVFGKAQKKKEVFTVENYGGNNVGTSITIRFEKGKEHNHPLYAIWLADENGHYIQSLYVSESIGKGVFKHATRANGKWLEGEIQRPAALPYWAYQRNVINEFGTYNPTLKHPVPDVFTGATPSSSFILHSKTVKPLKGKYKILFELNQPWDWNEYWTNDKYPHELDYHTSSQPALVYAVDIDTDDPKNQYTLKPIGHSHHNGSNGDLDTDLTTMTTALNIAKKITVTIN